MNNPLINNYHSENRILANRLRKARYEQSKRECDDNDNGMALAKALGKLDADIEAILNANDPQQYIRDIVDLLKKESPNE